MSSPAGPNAAEPFLSRSNNGLLLSWLEPVSKSDRVALRFARFVNGKWSDPRTIAERSDFFVNWADFPSIVEDAKGTLFAHWLQKSGNTSYAYDVRLAISKDGGATWSAPLLLNRDGKKGEHGFVTLAPLPKGGVGATWLDGRNMVEGKEEGDMTIRYATIDGAAVIRSDVQLDSRTCECCTTGMAMSSGRPVIAYRDRSPEEVRDIAVVRQTGTGWSKPRTRRWPRGWSRPRPARSFAHGASLEPVSRVRPSRLPILVLPAPRGSRAPPSWGRMFMSPGRSKVRPPSGFT